LFPLPFDLHDHRFAHLGDFSQANIYSFLESDDRIGTVLKYLDEAISELDNMDTLVSSYKIHLNVSVVTSRP
jgi:hypothetical protein